MFDLFEGLERLLKFNTKYKLFDNNVQRQENRTGRLYNFTQRRIHVSLFLK